MSLTFNMVGGGGGGLKATDALLRVQAPAGSTVTISKGTTTKSDLGHENADDNSVYDYYFIIHQSQFDSVNPWLITAVSASQTDTVTAQIIIDTADEYDVVMQYLTPPEYQAVEYLETTGNQYILTGITPAANFKAEVDVMQTVQPTGSTQYMVLSSNVSGGAGANYRWNIPYNSNGWAVYVGGSSDYSHNFTYGQTITDKVKITFEQTSSNTQTATLTRNGQTETLTTNKTVQTGRVLWLFCYRGYNGAYTYSRCRMYRAKMWNDGVLVGDYVPCYRKVDSVAGMWDRVNETFYTNNGTGTFTVGGNI